MSNDTYMTTVVQELRAARRERLPQLILGVFIVLVAAASFIGWLTRVTVTSIYNEALRQGVTNQPNPFLHASALDPVKNIVIYVALIGALLAIILGVQSTLRDRKAKVLDMVFSRPISKRHYVAAKFIGISAWLGIVMCAAAVFTWLSLWIIHGQPLALWPTGRLAVFFVISWLFLAPFTAIGMISGLASKRETSALLAPILLWVLLTFIVPQLGTAAEPISFLNPVPAQVASSGVFFQINHQILQPISYIDHYKRLSADTLGYDNASWKTQALETGLSVMAGVAVLIGFAPKAIRKGELYE